MVAAYRFGMISGFPRLHLCHRFGAYRFVPVYGPEDTPINTVKDLIDEELWAWRTDLVRATFSRPDADAILNIPLRHGGGDDSFAWAHEASGIYSVKSAYRSLMNHKEMSSPEEGTATSTSTTEEQMWNSGWKLSVVPKVRVFWWRALRCILPDEATLKRRHIKPISLCRVCLAEEESLMHALLHCSHARRFWDEALPRFDFKLPVLHPLTWDKDIMCDSRFSAAVRAKIITVMWAIWHSRNRIVHDEVSLDPIQTVNRIKEDLALLDIPSACAAVLPGHGWRPPEDGVIKINTDAAVNSEIGKAGAGVVASSATALVPGVNPMTG